MIQVLVGALFIASACGGSSSSSDEGDWAGSGGVAGLHGGSAPRAGAFDGGTPSVAGKSNAGGTPNVAGAGSGGAAGMSTSGGTTSGAVDCDPRKILCKRLAPDCPGDRVPSVEGTCYGPCVDIDACTCGEAEACPEQEQFTCHMHRKRCGPYLR